jgi:dihydrofolate synthase/folylpolyglutamate synthase
VPVAHQGAAGAAVAGTGGCGVSASSARAKESLDALIARLVSLHPKKIDLSLVRIERLLRRLGNPEGRLPPVIHVAGTNGKGSTIAFLRAILEAGGLGVHVYTSPSLVRFHERIRLAHSGGGRLVGDDALADALSTCERLNADEPITAFEIGTAAAFLLFANRPADALLLEVGLGGRLDATNVIERPAATIITPISIDHTEHLGPTLEEIAGEKAGILKRASPAVVARQDSRALAVIERAAARLRAPLSISGEHWTANEEGGRLVFADEGGLIDLPRPRLFGRHQVENAGAAIAAVRAAGAFAIPPAAYEAGMRQVDWPARMQRLGSGRLVQKLPLGVELWVDGGHNVAGAEATAAAIAELEERVSRPLVLVVGMLMSKDSDGFLSCFSELARHVFAVPVRAEASRPPAEVAAAATRAGLAAEAAANLESALQRIAALDLEIPPRVLVTGSLYLAGEVLALNGTPPV